MLRVAVRPPLPGLFYTHASLKMLQPKATAFEGPLRVAPVPAFNDKRARVMAPDALWSPTAPPPTPPGNATAADGPSSAAAVPAPGPALDAVRYVTVSSLPADVAGALNTLYGLLAFAAASNRVAFLPNATDDGVDLDAIIDVGRLRRSVLGLNAVWAATVPGSVAAAAAAGNVTALNNTLAGVVAQMQRWNTEKSRAIVVLAPRDAAACVALLRRLPSVGDPARFFQRVTTFSEPLRVAAASVLRTARTQFRITQLCALLVGNISRAAPADVAHLMRSLVEPHAAAAGCDGLFVAGRRVSAAELDALRQLTAMPILTLGAQSVASALPLSAAAAAVVNDVVELLVMQHATAAFATERGGALFDAVRQRRCALHRRFELRFSRGQHAGFAAVAPTLVAPPPGSGLAAAVPPYFERHRNEGIFVTELLPFAGFVQMFRVPC
jgi:hypothetical protein